MFISAKAVGVERRSACETLGDRVGGGETEGRVDAYRKIIFNYNRKLVRECVCRLFYTLFYVYIYAIISRHCFTAIARQRSTYIICIYICNAHVYINEERTSRAKQFWRIITVPRRVGGYNKRFYSICNRVEKTFPSVFSLRKKTSKILFRQTVFAQLLLLLP